MKKLFSGVQPSGNLHIGNYLGAIKQWLPLQDEYECTLFIADLHAITVPQDPEMLRKKTLEIAKIYLASGLDPEKCTLFVQSHVSAHSELMWILNTLARMGDLDKMTQFKDKAKLKHNLLAEVLNHTKESKRLIDLNSHKLESLKDSPEFDPGNVIETYSQVYTQSQQAMGEIIVSLSEVVQSILDKENAIVGLYDYPVLQAADILLYDTDVVPVGEDQMQHIELTRTLARRFNDRFGETFIIPEGKIQEAGARIMGLDDASKKMSKSAASEYNFISLMDDAETVRRKIKKAVTDSGTEITYSDERPALKNLITIYSLLSEKNPSDIVAMYQGKGYGDFKADLAEVVVNFLTPFQERFAQISDEEVKTILERGAKKAQAQAEKKMKEVREKVGLL